MTSKTGEDHSVNQVQRRSLELSSTGEPTSIVIVSYDQLASHYNMLDIQTYPLRLGCWWGNQASQPMWRNRRRGNDRHHFATHFDPGTSSSLPRNRRYRW